MNGFDLGGYALREPGGRTTRGANSVELPIPAVALAADNVMALAYFPLCTWLSGDADPSPP